MTRLTKAGLKCTDTIGLALAFLGIALFAWIHWRVEPNTVDPHAYQLAAEQANQWQALGGKWEVANGAVYSHSNERGAKLLTGSKAWRDYTVSSDIQFDSTSADMGVIIRSNNESQGIFAFDGYYVGLRSLDDTLVIGRANYGWAEARPVTMPGGVHPSQWYRLRVTAYGCNIAASAQNLSTLQTAWIAFEERSCIHSGRIGLRSLNAQGIWRNVSITNASLRDYARLQQHAACVEQPLIPNGPSWWTSWHITLLFAGALALALLIQLSYFRVQQWKAHTIKKERDWLAHELHDTMAQSFAGVGYQLRGIRSSILRGDSHDLEHIPDQLTVAYQLVRRCHEDASRTIAMLGKRSNAIQQDILQALAATARRIAGDEIRTVTRLLGSPKRISLQLSDALLHVGREAIANAVNHSKLTVLTITLLCDENMIELVIEDNGQGFEHTAVTAGVGILAMQKRVRGVSGALEILSSPGRGTRVRFTVISKDHWLRRWLSPSSASSRAEVNDSSSASKTIPPSLNF